MRRWVTVDVLERHNEVAGFIYAVIGVLYAVLLGLLRLQRQQMYLGKPPAKCPTPEAWDAYNQLWQTYYRFRPQNEHETAWYTQLVTRLNQLGDQRRLRLLSSRSGGIPTVMWGVLLGAGAITIGPVCYLIW